MLKLFIAISGLTILFFIRHTLTPFFIGLAIAYVLDPYVSLLSLKLKGHRLLSVFIAYLTFLAAGAGLVWGFSNMVVGKIETGSLQESFHTLREYYTAYGSALGDSLGFSPAKTDVSKLIQTIGSGAVKFFVGAVAGIYLLKDKDFFLRLGNQILHLLLKQKTHGYVREILFEINQVISSFLRGVFIDSVIVAFLSSLALSILKVDYALFIGCFAGLANIIPYFGPIIGIIPAFFSALTEGGLPLAFLAALSLFAVQQLECNFIYPRIIGESTGLHPLFVLLAVSIAGSLGGLLWMVLAVPIAGIIKVLLTKWAEMQ